MVVQFDAPEEAAYYLDRLEKVRMVKNVKLVNVAANSETSGEPEDHQVVPRYMAQYELELQQADGEGKKS